MKYFSHILFFLVLLCCTKLIQMNELQLLIHPRYFWLVYFTCIIMVLLILFTKPQRIKQSPLVLSLNVVALCIIMYGSIFPLQPISAQRSSGTQIQPTLKPSEHARLQRSKQFSFDVYDRSFADWLIIFAMDPEPGNYQDEPIRLIGSYYIDESGHPALGRHILSCCMGDARVAGIRLAEPLDVDPDTWMQVEGVLSAQDGAIVIQVNAAVQVDVPKNPYIAL